MAKIAWERDTSLGYAMLVVNDSTGAGLFSIDSSNGDSSFAGSVTAQSFNTSSSLAIKSDVSDLGTETAEEFIQNLRPVTFRYRERLDDGKEHVGLIAEEVSHIHPSFAPNGKSVSYAEITATLIKTVQTLMKRVDELSQKLEGRLP